MLFLPTFLRPASPSVIPGKEIDTTQAYSLCCRNGRLICHLVLPGKREDMLTPDPVELFRVRRLLAFAMDRFPAEAVQVGL
jgi:hypothetical protein